MVASEGTVDDRASQQRGWRRTRAQSMLEASASSAGPLPAGDGEAVSSGQRHTAGRPSATVIELATM
jgi:hypothetical protein